MQHFLDAIKQYADFSGRATRTQYWMYILFYMIFYVVAAVIDAVIGIGIFTAVYALGLLIPSLAIAARRLHDTNRSGWWQLIALVPLVGLVLIYFLVLDSDDDNRFGPNPKKEAAA
ncbi:hypothetical protein CAI21_03235 [Alkalilimnicola ehrlichii]|uniref:DUF805 domain-containing protein n=1 Tax=Alkalilimnicola ehrlichii TaxID=351052 RepID=A0A3E0X2X8_9GAMM|nr:DUF805 domain-containing protein [Alkalilimnicola ehrlichii]RFA31001.1 hypothetical protein CAI21_03235 [Alkalilimnicola ehrlichii]RFA38953.1 hypothetical protein CAL65_03380 [Alkalilimnicola ehrlichii]